LRPLQDHSHTLRTSLSRLPKERTRSTEEVDPEGHFFKARWSTAFDLSTLDSTQRGSVLKDRSRWRQLVWLCSWKGMPPQHD